MKERSKDLRIRGLSGQTQDLTGKVATGFLGRRASKSRKI